MDNFEKQRIALRYWLLGKGWGSAVEAMDFAASYHTGKRRGGDPEFSHQVSIANYIRTLPLSDDDMKSAIIVALLHDTIEDHDVSPQVIMATFDGAIADSVEAMSKLLRHRKKTPDEYFAKLAEDRIASLVKGGDRIHNFSTMVGVFTREGQLKYVAEAKERIIPMLKLARRNFPANERAYENIKVVLGIQIDMIERILALDLQPSTNT
jgi:(p)ppGpp synthase/HD superfamily hydrolase